jgi:hypothetical protein
MMYALFGPSNTNRHRTRQPRKSEDIVFMVGRMATGCCTTSGRVPFNAFGKAPFPNEARDKTRKYSSSDIVELLGKNPPCSATLLAAPFRQQNKCTMSPHRAMSHYWRSSNDDVSLQLPAAGQSLAGLSQE